MWLDRDGRAQSLPPKSSTPRPVNRTALLSYTCCMPKKGEGLQGSAGHEASARQDSARGDALEQAKRNRAFERMLKITEGAQPGEVFFVGAVTAPLDPSNLMSLGERAAGRREFGNQLKSKHEGAVVVLTHEDIKREGTDVKSATTAAIEKVRTTNKEAVIIVETPLFLDKIVAEPWEANTELMEKMMRKDGKQRLTAWLKNLGKGEGEEEDPTLEELRRIFEGSKDSIRHYIELELRAPLTYVGALNPAMLIFLVFLKRGRIDVDYIKSISADISDWENTIAYVKFEDVGNVRVQIGDRAIDAA